MTSDKRVTQSCPTFCDLVDYAVYGILLAKILESVAVLFSRWSFLPRDWTQVSHIAGGIFTTREPKNTRVGSLSLLQQIFLTQESNWGLLHSRQILYQLSYQGSSRVRHMPIIYPSHFSSLRVTRAQEHKKTCTHLFPAALPTVAQNWKPSKYPSTGQRTNCYRSIQWKTTQE